MLMIDFIGLCCECVKWPVCVIDSRGGWCCPSMTTVSVSGLIVFSSDGPNEISWFKKKWFWGKEHRQHLFGQLADLYFSWGAPHQLLCHTFLTANMMAIVYGNWPLHTVHACPFSCVGQSITGTFTPQRQVWPAERKWTMSFRSGYLSFWVGNQVLTPNAVNQGDVVVLDHS